ncbi:uncharacterized protein LOC134319112 [Trichomycterus rosablanca]|uniref:uncharacterized protein LOC134319112 n=1 Tax=Trichomycterus rosablanca TaxID=2290929 RepID=UPI002F359721
MSMTEEAAVLPILLRVPVDISEYRVLIPAVWSTEVQEWEINCMNSLILEETAEEHHTERTSQEGVSLSIEEKKDLRPPVEKPEEDKASKKEAAGSGGKNVFARILKAAQQYLADSTKQSAISKAKSPSIKNSPAAARLPKKRTSAPFTLAQKRRSQRRQSQNASVGGSRKGPVTPQNPDRGATEDSSQMHFRRLQSGPVGRVARRRSGSQSTRVKSPLLQTQSSVSSKLSQNKDTEESRESPHRISSPKCAPLSESNTNIDYSPVTQGRESQLI